LGGRSAPIAGIPKWIGKELDEFTGRVLSACKKVQIEFVEVENRTKARSLINLRIRSYRKCKYEVNSSSIHRFLTLRGLEWVGSGKFGPIA
jgi:hypothetical protein